MNIYCPILFPCRKQRLARMFWETYEGQCIQVSTRVSKGSHEDNAYVCDCVSACAPRLALHEHETCLLHMNHRQGKESKQSK